MKISLTLRNRKIVYPLHLGRPVTTAFPDSAKIKYEAVLDERYFYTNGLIYTYVEKRQSFCTMYALGGAVDIFALSLSLHPRCIVTSIDNVF